MVFEETAGATLESAHLEPLVGSRSQSPGTFRCLTIERSDPSSLKPASEASPVPCLKEPFKYSAGFESVDAKCSKKVWDTFFNVAPNG